MQTLVAFFIFFNEKFAHIKILLYLCSVFVNKPFIHMKKLFILVSVLALSFAASAQDLSTGIQYLQAAAAENAAQRKRAEARGELVQTKVAFQANVDISGRVHWGTQPSVKYYGKSYGGNKNISGGPAVNVDLGVRINNAYFIGVGAQLGADFGKFDSKILSPSGNNYIIHITDAYIPIYGDFKIYIPSSTGICPYFDAAIGGYIKDWITLKSPLVEDLGEENLKTLDLDNLKVSGDKMSYRNKKGGFYLHAAVGADIDKICVSAGYEMTTYEEDASIKVNNNVVLKIGVRIGG